MDKHKTIKDILSKKSLHLLGMFTFVLILLSVVNVEFFDDNADFAKRIVNSWMPNEDIGKLKYVSTDETGYGEVVSLFSIDYSLPFANGICFNGETDGEVIVNGNGDIVVLAPYKSTVESIVTDGVKKVVTFNCGYSVKVSYGNIDIVGVLEGERVIAGQAIGTSNESKVIVRVLFRGHPYTKFRVDNGRLSF